MSDEISDDAVSPARHDPPHGLGAHGGHPHLSPEHDRIDPNWSREFDADMGITAVLDQMERLVALLGSRERAYYDQSFQHIGPPLRRAWRLLESLPPGDTRDTHLSRARYLLRLTDTRP